MPGKRVCSTCEGSGKCPDCFGTGVNIHVNQDEPMCRICSGSGKCPGCEGTGKPGHRSSVLGIS
jgi:hypothetical protein